MAYTKPNSPTSPSSSTPARDTEPVGTLPEVTVTPDDDPDAEIKEAIDMMIEHGPAAIKKMTPADLETLRKQASDFMVGGGSASTLVDVAEMMSEASKDLAESQKTGTFPTEVTQGLPVTAGQAVNFADMMGQVMCRVADQQLKKETEADQTTVDQTRNSPEAREAETNLKQSQELRKRLDLACQP